MEVFVAGSGGKNEIASSWQVQIEVHKHMSGGKSEYSGQEPAFGNSRNANGNLHSLAKFANCTGLKVLTFLPPRSGKIAVHRSSVLRTESVCTR